MSDKLSVQNVDDRHKAPQLPRGRLTAMYQHDINSYNINCLPEEVGNEINPITMKAQNDDDCTEIPTVLQRQLYRSTYT